MLNAENSKQDTIQDIALKLAEQQLTQLQNENQTRERVVFVLGSKGVGKTTAINAFFDRDETPKSTLALEYAYGRKQGSTQKQLLHMWELGSLEKSEDLTKVPLKSHGLEQLSCVIMLDLTQPQRLWLDLKTACEHLKDIANGLLLRAKNDEMEKILYDKAKERVSKKEHKDLPSLSLMPFPVIIVGGKYDLFINNDPDLKKHISRCLRSMAHLMGASLLFYSSKIQKLSKTLRDTLSHLAFGTPSHPFRTHCIDHNDALSIWFGNDTWDKIGPMGVQTIQTIESYFVEEVPQEQTMAKEVQHLQDPAKDAGFREGIIDEMRSQKDEELRGIVRDHQMRGKFESVRN